MVALLGGLSPTERRRGLLVREGGHAGAEVVGAPARGDGLRLQLHLGLETLPCRLVEQALRTAERARRAYMVDLRKPRSDLQEARVANASMIMTYDRNRVVRRAGRISTECQSALEQAMRLHLALDPV